MAVNRNAARAVLSQDAYAVEQPTLEVIPARGGGDPSRLLDDDFTVRNLEEFARAS